MSRAMPERGAAVASHGEGEPSSDHRTPQLCRTEDRDPPMIRTTHLRSGEHKPHAARPRSGIFRTRRSPPEPWSLPAASMGSPRLRDGALPQTPLATSTSSTHTPHASERILIVCGVIGLVLFPIAGAAMLGRLVGPVAFMFVATVALVLFYGSLSRLESSNA